MERQCSGGQERSERQWQGTGGARQVVGWFGWFGLVGWFGWWLVGSLAGG
jgi:hypothetical protein